MDNDRTINESDVQDGNMRDRNITDSGARVSSETKSRSESGTLGRSIEDDIDTNDDTSTQSEDISSRSDLGVGE